MLLYLYLISTNYKQLATAVFIKVSGAIALLNANILPIFAISF